MSKVFISISNTNNKNKSSCYHLVLVLTSVIDFLSIREYKSSADITKPSTFTYFININYLVFSDWQLAGYV